VTADPATTRRDYGLTGEESRRAVERGLAEAEWFRPTIDAAVLGELSRRTNLRSAIDQTLWLALLLGSGFVAWRSMWSWWSIPAFAFYGALYGGAADSRWHECAHGTAFRSRRANDLVYYLACFMMLRGPTVWRWSHHRHHTDTIIVGRDPEIAFPRPPSLWQTAVGFTGYWVIPEMLGRLVRHALGRIDDDAKAFVPEDELGRVVRESRVFVAVVASAAAACLVLWTPGPLLLVGLPSMYGAWLMVFFGLTQHAGLREDVLDHRLNSRTVEMNPIFRFLYLNMNFHVEHHLLPTVPYRNLPRLNRTIADQLVPARPSTFAAYREIVAVLRRQQRDPSYELPLDVPDVGGERLPVDTGLRHWHPVGDGDGVVELGSVDDLEPGRVTRVDIGEDSFVLYRLDDGGSPATVVLADGHCTHQRVHLCDGLVIDGMLECPRHNGRFDARTGEARRTPVREPLRVHRVQVRDGRVVVRLRDLAAGTADAD
jgi:Na+-transporting NADH:ubiquinone oxidoreductase subunit F